MKISILELLAQRHAKPKEEAEAIFQLICSHISDPEPVDIDFTGVEDLTPSVIEVIFGRLYATYPAELLKTRLSVRGLSAVDQSLLAFFADRGQNWLRRTRPILPPTNQSTW